MGDTTQNPNNDQGQSSALDWGKVAIDDAGFSKLIEENEAFKKLYEPHKDRVVSQAIKTFTATKQKEWEKERENEIEKVISSRFPAETEEQKKLRQLQAENEKLKETNKLEALINKGTNYAHAKGLEDMADIIEKVVKSVRDEDGITELIESLDLRIKNREKKASEKILANTTRKTESGDSDVVPMFSTNEQWKDFFKKNPEKAQQKLYQDAYTKFCNNRR